MNNEILLTISIAAYNVEKYLRKCVTSCFVANEYVSKLEVIIVNDGSTDNTLKIAKELQNTNPNLIKIINKKNGGHGSTINSAIKIAKGKYFKILDGDDWVDTKELERLLKYLSERDEDLILMDYSKKYMDEENILETELCEYKKFQPDNKFSYLDLNNIYITHFASAIKTNLLQNSENTIVEKCFYTDHMYVFYCLAYTNMVIYSKINVYQYRLGRVGQSVSLTGILNHLGDNWKVLQAELNYLERKKFDNFKRDILNGYMAILAKDVIGYYLLAKCSKEMKCRIKEIDSVIKTKNYEVYKKMEKISRPIKILRGSNYMFYTMCHYNERRKHL